MMLSANQNGLFAITFNFDSMDSVDLRDLIEQKTCLIKPYTCQFKSIIVMVLFAHLTIK